MTGSKVSALIVRPMVRADAGNGLSIFVELDDRVDARIDLFISLSG
ncbi:MULTISPECIES: hypothetical protein [unclassified Mesorhizobium]|nr:MULTISPECIES: hypothetical protein [unclassified Mesorhizobium]ESY45950.1 hypothetical protein X745_31255 [Mesorhizobium sp. LNJC374B00]ESY50734.1 hypothetical protein X744_31900 [Mesorhizobium sp. LNJC372A00]WJI80974.1 hypothetical protein NLY34_30090 [Mesorhizobium sp. C374B]WJI87514.1 hypothetical protein NLY42_00840 [Mesorhizobium sp. C372A]